MNTNYLHPEHTTKKSSVRAWPVLLAFAAVAAVTLASVALAADPAHTSGGSDQSQAVAESAGNPIADKYSMLVMRVYFGDRSERDRLAQELNPEEVPTTGGYLTVIRDRALYDN